MFIFFSLSLILRLSTLFFFFFFFFRQKTSYEMSIGDWRSDVCSSDRCGAGGFGSLGRHHRRSTVSDAAGSRGIGRTRDTTCFSDRGRAGKWPAGTDYSRLSLPSSGRNGYAAAGRQTFGTAAGASPPLDLDSAAAH